jgi:hypothetical protein
MSFHHGMETVSASRYLGYYVDGALYGAEGRYTIPMGICSTLSGVVHHSLQCILRGMT